MRPPKSLKAKVLEGLIFFFTLFFYFLPSRANWSCVSQSGVPHWLKSHINRSINKKIKKTHTQSNGVKVNVICCRHSWQSKEEGSARPPSGMLSAAHSCKQSLAFSNNGAYFSKLGSRWQASAVTKARFSGSVRKARCFASLIQDTVSLTAIHYHL